MSTLLPCPFCPGLAVTDFIEGESYIIECNVCEARTGSKDCPEAAIEAWNRRTVDSELLAAAKAVVARWDSPKWKDAPHTAEFIDRLRAAIAVKEKT